MPNRKPLPNSAPLAPSLRAQLQTLVRQVGESRAVAQLDLPRNTLARAIAGFGLREGTRLLIEVRLDQHPHRPEVA